MARMTQLCRKCGKRINLPMREAGLYCSDVCRTADTLIHEGYTESDGGRFLTSAKLYTTIRNGEAVTFRKCFELVNGRWEGFASMTGGQ